MAEDEETGFNKENIHGSLDCRFQDGLLTARAQIISDGMVAAACAGVWWWWVGGWGWAGLGGRGEERGLCGLANTLSASKTSAPLGFVTLENGADPKASLKQGDGESRGPMRGPMHSDPGAMQWLRKQ